MRSSFENYLSSAVRFFQRQLTTNNSQKQSGRSNKLKKWAKPHLILKGCICNTKPTSAPRFFLHALQFLQFLELTNNISSAISAKSLAVKPVAKNSSS